MKTSFLILISVFCNFHLCFSQNIGIGTIIPTEKLQVAGNIAADTLKPNAFKLPPNAGVGKVLTSDASGNASWQTNTTSSTAGNIGYGVWGDCATNGNIGEYQPIGDQDGAPNDLFGVVAMSGGYAAVGAPSDDIGSNVDQGSVSIYRWNGSSWEFMQKITDATGAPNDYFGFSVSMSGSYLIVGAYLDDIGANTDQGSVSIFQYNGVSWVLMQKLTDPVGAPTDNFGWAVSISGGHALVGAHQDDNGAVANQGSASAYQWNGSNWILTNKIVDPAGTANDLFGYAVAISSNYCIMGSPGDQVGSWQFQGSACVFQFNGSSWSFMQKISDSDGQATDNFGLAVSIDGNSILVGVPSDDVAAGSSGASNHGSAVFFQRNGNAWDQVQKVWGLTRPAECQFGNWIQLSGNYAILGAPSDDAPIFNQGSSTIYQRIGTGWSRLQLITDPDPAENGNFGIRVAMDGITKRFIIGCTLFSNARGKAVFGKLN